MSSKLVFQPKVTTSVVFTKINHTTLCSNNDSVTLEIKPLPEAGFKVGYHGGLYQFDAIDTSFDSTQYYWTFGDGFNGFGKTIRHQYDSIKKNIITLRINNNGCSGERDSIVDLLPLQLRNIKINSAVCLFPNPANGHVNVISESDILNVELFDHFGRTIIAIGCISSKAAFLDLNELRNGVYLIKIEDSHGIHCYRLIKN